MTPPQHVVAYSIITRGEEGLESLDHLLVQMECNDILKSQQSITILHRSLLACRKSMVGQSNKGFSMECGKKLRFLIDRFAVVHNGCFSITLAVEHTGRRIGYKL